MITVSLRDHDKNKYTVEVMRNYAQAKYKLYGSLGTALYLKEHGIQCKGIKLEKLDKMLGNEINIVINVPEVSNKINTGMFPVRRKAIEHGIPVLTCMDTAKAYLTAAVLKKKNTKVTYKPLF